MSRDGKTKIRREQVIAAIPGTGGIKTVIAKRLGVTRNTFDSYLKRWASVQEAYEQETQAFLDVAESVVQRNITLAYKQQQEGEIVNTQDAKWYLARKGAARGFSDRVDIQGDVNVRTWPQIVEVVTIADDNPALDN